MFAEIINTYGVEILGTILVAIAGVVAMALKNLATKYINTETKAKLARSVVLFVEQACKDLHGREKLDKALARLSDLLLNKGIDFTLQELETLVEAAVAEFNRVFDRTPVLEGIAVEDMSDDQLRSVLEQLGLTRTYIDGLTREQMLQVLDTMAAQA